MKYFLLISLVFITTFIGYLFSKKYKTRSNFFQALLYLCQKFDIEINFSRERLKNIFENIDEKNKGYLKGINTNFISFIDKETSLDKDNLFKGINFLKDDEKDVIFTFFKSLGRSDVDSQSKEIKNFQTRFETFSSQANQDNKKYGSLSVKLGLVVGLLIVVIFI